MVNDIILGVKKEEDPSENRVSIVPKDIKSIIISSISGYNTQKAVQEIKKILEL